MKLLMLSTDRRILEEGTVAHRRMQSYGTLFEELHIVVLARKSDAPVLQHTDASRISDNAFVHRTYSKSGWFMVWDGYGIAKRILKQNGDWAISAQDPFEVGFLGWLLRLRFKRVPLQLQVHTDFLSPWFARESFKNRMRVRLARFTLPRADRIRVVSERIKHSLISYYLPLKPRITVLPIFVNLAQEQADPAAVQSLRKEYAGYRFRLLVLSRLTREKNIALAIRAMWRTAKTHPDLLLMIVGDGPERAALERLVHTLNLEANVRFVPWTERPASYYAAADAFLLTSNYEGYGRTVVEAMAAGLPVVMTDVGLAGEVLIPGKSGIVVPVDDARAVADAIAEIVEHPVFAKKLGEGARAAAHSLPGERAYMASYRHALEFHS